MSTLPDMLKPGLAVFDMDSTLIQLESIDAIAAAGGNGAAVAKITEKAMRGELDFKEALHERVKMLAGVSEEVIFGLADNLPFTEGADELMRFLRKYRWRIAIVSGGFTWFADMAAMRWGADYVACNVLEVVDGKLSGRLLGPIIDGQAKADALEALMRQYGLPREQVIAIGDGANDIPMIEAAGFGVAFNGKPALVKVSDLQIEGSLAKLIEVLA